MFTQIKHFFAARSQAKAFAALAQTSRSIVFYAEDTHSYMHFAKIIQMLTKQHNKQVCYLTSVLDDPILKQQNPSIKAFYIGAGIIRMRVFLRLQAEVMIMTMPDIELYHLQRSKIYPVHYIYLFHAMVSTHSIYRKGAFNHYDTIFCTGSYQVDEIRATEKVYNLPDKNLLEIGYPRLQELMDEVAQLTAAATAPAQKTIIIAPSWGKHGTLEVCGIELIKVLLAAGYQTIVRPHPMTTLHNRQLIAQIDAEFSAKPNFSLQLDIRDKESLYTSDILISDWSGVAIEYAFACEKPVIFIDVPKKRNNPEDDRLGLVPIETSIRDKIGRIVSPTQLKDLANIIEELYADQAGFIEDIRRARTECVFNLGSGVDKSVAAILDIENNRTSI
jgi:hypothetical protein